MSPNVSKQICGLLLTGFLLGRAPLVSHYLPPIQNSQTSNVLGVYRAIIARRPCPIKLDCFRPRIRLKVRFCAEIKMLNTILAPNNIIQIRVGCFQGDFNQKSFSHFFPIFSSMFPNVSKCFQTNLRPPTHRISSRPCSTGLTLPFPDPKLRNK